MGFSKRLVAFRNSLRESQETFARAMGVSKSTYQNYEYDRGYPPADKLANLSKSYNISSDYLLGLSDNAQNNCAKCELKRKMKEMLQQV